MPKRPRGKRVRGDDGSFTVSAKAANGEGSLYREADGVWRATYRVPGESRAATSVHQWAHLAQQARAVRDQPFFDATLGERHHGADHDLGLEIDL